MVYLRCNINEIFGLDHANEKFLDLMHDGQDTRRGIFFTGHALT